MQSAHLPKRWAWIPGTSDRRERRHVSRRCLAGLSRIALKALQAEALQAVIFGKSGMRPRAGSQPVTLEPSLVIEVLSLARAHDDILKETRQDLFRAETKRRIEQRWKWPIRLACVALGAGGLAALENEALPASALEFIDVVRAGLLGAGNLSLAGFIALCAVAWGAFYLGRRALRGPTPEQQARKLMEQFAQKNGVAAYVFAGQDSPEDEAASIGALTRPEIKHFRKRHLTTSNRTLQSSLQRLLNRSMDDSQQILHEPR